ncbi:hypothetical protein SCLCIDRAFT_1207044 [Scleroderma citrinum Foug A]|uniref:Uncharacterized protein n=1 Tax=Scleroderma citrinum Foug A TaxID=1036808 RepID=A0A0C3EDV0_9AGAM|nr:hypothetical protein SCLCIDRAFT_1207044 [Scleroderma citrinum Foug A]
MVTRLRLRLFCGFERTVYRRNADETWYTWREHASPFWFENTGTWNRSALATLSGVL